MDNIIREDTIVRHRNDVERGETGSSRLIEMEDLCSHPLPHLGDIGPPIATNNNPLLLQQADNLGSRSNYKVGSHFSQGGTAVEPLGMYYRSSYPVLLLRKY
uniref:SFRICE_011460 n=1 Tax=Spodoptera frugiperda TaxID=7108 RepID=A0A2H1W8J3_SPOFR